MAQTPTKSNVRWTLGKGVIGQAWETMDLADHYTDTEWAVMPSDRAAYDALSDDARMGLRFRDFMALRGKYAGVIALPVRGHDGVAGVVAADIRSGQGGGQGVTPVDCLFHAAVLKELNALASQIEQLLAPAPDPVEG